MTEPEQTEVIMRHHNLAAALAAFQAVRPTLTKTNTADVIKEGRKLYSYQYADLADVEEAVLPLLGVHGLAWHCHTEAAGREMRLVCTLEHESGDMRSSAFPLDVKLTDPQGLGSYLTYFQRYALMMMTGVHAAGEDDDGQRAQAAGPAHREETAQPRQEPREAGRGTRQGAADGYAWALATADLAKLPEIWEHVEAGGFAQNTPQPTRADEIRKHFGAMELPPESEPGRQFPMAYGNLAQIAAYRLIVAGWNAQNYGALEHAVTADRVYMHLASRQPNFGRFVLSKESGGQRLGDWLALTVAELSRARAAEREQEATRGVTPQEREANSDPEINPTPPWVVSADQPEAHVEQGPDVSGYEGETPWYDSDDAEDNDTGRPAVLEGQE